jgi:cellulose synthase operon protein C
VTAGVERRAGGVGGPRRPDAAWAPRRACRPGGGGVRRRARRAGGVAACIAAGAAFSMVIPVAAAPAAVKIGPPGETPSAGAGSSGRAVPDGSAIQDVAGRSAASPEVEALLREGRYGDAILLLEEALEQTPDALAPLLFLAELLLETGAYERAEALLREGAAAHPRSARIPLLLGRTLARTGRPVAAEAAFGEAEEKGGADGLLGELHRGELLLAAGRRDEAFGIFDAFIDVYNRSPSLGSRELQAVATAVRHLGVADPALFQDALRAYDEAVAADPGNLEAHLGTGELFLDRFNAPDARKAFRRVLDVRPAHPEALLGLARVAAFEGSTEAVGRLEEALGTNPRLVPALVLRARLHLAAEDVASAEADLDRALRVDPYSPEARAVAAGLHLVRGDREAYRSLEREALERNPRDGAFFETVAELAGRARLYSDAVAMADRGVRADSLGWGVLTARGLNRLRTGAVPEGRADLERAFEGDPFNVRVKNTLDLLDVMEGFESWEGRRVVLHLDPEDGEALAIHMLEVADRSWEELSARYGHHPPSPIRIEAFRRRADFSVRTVGITGLGALGVAFGSVLAMESPAARGIEGFHWASVLWHEMAHAVHLSITEHRVPRWFTEGLAVHEERRAGEGWGGRPSLSFLTAYRAERLRPPSELSQAFVRPRYPEEVGYSYVLGSLVAEWIEEAWGFEAILGILEGFLQGRSTAEALRSELGLGEEAMDAAFDAWFRDRYAGPLAAAAASEAGRERPAAEGRGAAWLRSRVQADPADVEAHLALGRLHLEEGRPGEAIPHLETARALFPGNPDPSGPNRLLARAHRERGSDAAALAALEAHLRAAGGDYGAWLEAADLRERAGDPEGAARALEGAVLVYPYDIQVLERLAGHHGEVGRHEREVRARRAVLALGPVDRPGALHRLGEAQLAAGDLAAARRSALAALELAPRFGEAQELLLRVVEAEARGERDGEGSLPEAER